ncbi:MAG: restriction endonuclease [Fimbriimonadaceae bacterium]
MNETELQIALQQCSLHTLLILVSKGLTRAGFGDVQILDRRENRQKTRFGGHELICQTTLGSFEATVVVKVINDAVRLRMLDEMAGTVLRRKADAGIIVSPRHVTATARKVQASYRPCRIEVIDGQALSALLSRFQIGVRGRGDVDYAFLTGLEEASRSLRAFIKANAV